MAPLRATSEVVASGFGIPWAVEVLSEDEYLITERFGTVFLIRHGQRVALDGLPESQIIHAASLFLGGYNDVSLHPRFERNGLVYLAYVNANYRMAVGRFDFSEGQCFDGRWLQTGCIPGPGEKEGWGL